MFFYANRKNGQSDSATTTLSTSNSTEKNSVEVITEDGKRQLLKFDHFEDYKIVGLDYKNSTIRINIKDIVELNIRKINETQTKAYVGGYLILAAIASILLASVLP